MAILKKLPDPLPTLPIRRANSVEDLVDSLTNIVQGIDKAHKNIVEVVNDHASTYSSGWSTSNGNVVKAVDANGTLAHLGDALTTLVDVLIAKGVLTS